MKFVALLAFVYCLAQSFNWPPVSDAANYIDASQSLMAGRGYLNGAAHDDPQSPYTQWTPLLPTLYALIRLTGLDLLTGIRLLNATCYALLIYVVGQSISRWRAPLLLALFTPPFVWLYTFAWSEPLFNLLVAVFFVLLFREPPRLLALSIVVTLACLQRYSGLALIATGALYLFWRWGWRQALAFVLLPSVCIGGWMLYNMARGYPPMGLRSAAKFALDYNVASALVHLSLWIGVIGLCFAVDWIVRRLRFRFSSSATPFS